MGGAAVSLVSLGAFSTSASGSGIGLGAGLGNILTMLAVIGNALLEAVGLRRKRYPWGTVFNVADDQPLQLAIVRLKNSAGRLLETRVTDQTGRVGFLATPGDYHLEVLKNNFAIAALKAATGSRYQPVSDGKSLRIPNASVAIQANIPMQTIGTEKTSWKAHILQTLHLPLLLLTVGLASLTAYIAPTFLNFLLLSLPLLVLLGEWLIIHPHSFGVVSDEHQRELTGVPIQLVNNANLKVMATQITDVFGRYSFLVRPGEYHLRIADDKYGALPPQLDNRKFVITSPTGGLIAPSFRVQPKNHQSL